MAAHGNAQKKQRMACKLISEISSKRRNSIGGICRRRWLKASMAWRKAAWHRAGKWRKEKYNRQAWQALIWP